MEANSPTVGILAYIQDKLKKESVTKILGQPTSHDLTILEKELIAILAAIPTALGGGDHRHAGMIMETVDCTTMTGGTAFINPANPGIYPAGLPANAVVGTRARAEAEHKELINQFKTYKGVRQGAKDFILEAVVNEYCIEIEYKTVGYLNLSPREMINHLQNRGGTLNFADTKTLLAERDGEQDASKIQQLYFNRIEKAIKSLTQAGINSDPNERLDMALYYFKAAGKYNAAVYKWEAKPAVDKTWANIKTFISAEYAKENKENKHTLKCFKANAMQEQAEAIKELIVMLT